MHLGRDIKVDVLVFDFERAPQECVVIFCERVVVVSEELDDICFHADD
jgi:hypothetical protein